MTTLQATTAPSQLRTAGRISVWGVLRSEWLKLASLRSTYWLAGITLLGAVGAAGMFGLLFRVLDEDINGADPSMGGEGLGAPGPTFVGASVTSIALVTIGILAVLAITSEYSSGSIRTTITAVPARQLVFNSKIVVVTLATGVLTLVTTGLTWVTMQLIYPNGFNGTEANAFKVIGGTTLYLMAIAVFALGVGALVRSSAAAMSIVLGLFLILEQVLLLVAVFSKPVAVIVAFLPSTAGSLITHASMSQVTLTQITEAPVLTPWQGFGVLMVWVVVIYALGALRMQKGDA